MDRVNKQTLCVLGGIAAVVGLVWWLSRGLEEQRRLESALPGTIQDHYDRANAIPEVVLYEQDM